jgi:hypothetical protein
MHSVPHIPKLRTHSKNPTPTNKTSAKSRSPLNKEKKNPPKSTPVSLHKQASEQQQSPLQTHHHLLQLLAVAN